MNGRIKMYNENRAFGFIAGDNGSDYFFHISSFKSACQPSRGLSVSFDPEQQEKGLVAKNIYVPDNVLNRPQFLEFGGARIKLTNIKNYGIAQGDGWYAKMYRDVPAKYITKKKAFGKTVTELVSEATIEETGEVYPIDVKENVESYHPYIHGRPTYNGYEIGARYGPKMMRKVVEYHVWNRGKQATIRVDHAFHLDANGNIVSTQAALSSEHLFTKPENYLYVTTFQGDNYKWFEHHVKFDIYEKCKELDKYMT